MYSGSGSYDTDSGSSYDTDSGSSSGGSYDISDNDIVDIVDIVDDDGHGGNGGNGGNGELVDTDTTLDAIGPMMMDDAYVASSSSTISTTVDKWLEDQLRVSIFYEEPVSHITFHTMFVSDSGELERVESRVVELAEPNVVDRFVIGRIVKRARLTAGGVIGYRLNSLFVYNMHVSLPELAKYVRNPGAFSFFVALTSLNDIPIKPTLACFHSLNSVHIVLRRLPQLPQLPLALANDARVVSITQGALSARRRYTRRRGTGGQS